MKRQPNASLKRRIAALLFRYHPTLDRLNWNSKWHATIQAARCPEFSSKEQMYHHLENSLIKGNPIDYLEFGVAGGVSLRSWCATNSHKDSRFFGFDTFTGLPEDWTPEWPKGSFSPQGKVPDIADSRLSFQIGLFQSTLPTFLDSYRLKNRLVIHNDSDLYSSTLYALTMLDRLISPETIVIFDEFWDSLHEYKALVDYCASYRRQFKIIATTRYFSQVALQLERIE